MGTDSMNAASIASLRTKEALQKLLAPSGVPLVQLATMMSLARCPPVRRHGVWVIVVLVVASHGAAGRNQGLIEAVKQHDPEAIRVLLAQQVDVNAAEADGSTALHWATYADDLDTAGRLIRAGARADAANDHGVTPLSLACTNRSAALVTILLEAGADANAAVWSGETVLMTCARTGSVEAVAALLAGGADVNHTEPSEDQTALMWAVSERHAAVARALVEHGANVTARSKRGFTPMLFAAREGDLDSARLLLGAGASADDAAPDGTSALVVATVRGHTAFAMWLLEQGADPNADGAGYAALHWASGLWETELTGPGGIVTDREDEWRALTGVPTGKLELVRALVAHGADPNVRATKSPRRIGFTVIRPNLDGATPFYLAAMAGDLETMRELVAHGADPHIATAKNMTPLMAAAGVGRRLIESTVTADRALAVTQVVWELGGGDVNAVNDAGDTALHGAANMGSGALVQFLVDQGAVVNVENKRGRPPLTMAAGTDAEDLLRDLATRDGSPSQDGAQR